VRHSIVEYEESAPRYRHALALPRLAAAITSR